MTVWYCIPSARPPAEANEILKLWRAQGYKIALMCDSKPDAEAKIHDACLVQEYPGYSKAVNELIHNIIWDGPTYHFPDPDAEWFVTGGDDVAPDANHTAEEIARQCSQHFKDIYRRVMYSYASDYSATLTHQNHEDLRIISTFGVMQPTGDRFADGSIDRICGSPWMGREFCRRAYGGNGPMWPEYFHMFNDEELQHVAIKLGCFWQRPDLIHLHHWWGRRDLSINSPATGWTGNPAAPTRAVAPKHLERANSQENWDAMKAIFESRRRAGFPGHEPVP